MAKKKNSPDRKPTTRLLAPFWSVIMLNVLCQVKYLPVASIMEQLIFISERGFFPLCLEYILIKRAEVCACQIIWIILRLLD